MSRWGEAAESADLEARSLFLGNEKTSLLKTFYQLSYTPSTKCDFPLEPPDKQAYADIVSFRQVAL